MLALGRSRCGISLLTESFFDCAVGCYACFDLGIQSGVAADTVEVRNVTQSRVDCREGNA